jgi:cell division protein FtsQ
MNHKKLYIVLFAFSLACFMILCGFAHQWKQFLTVDKVEVEGNYILQQQDVISLSGIPLGKEIFQVSLDSVRMSIKTNSYVEDVHVSRILPGIIHIQLVERQPIASLMLSKQYYLDKNGNLLPKISTDVIMDLPVITGVNIDAKNISFGNKILEMDVYSALQILETANSLNREIYDFISEVNLNYGNDITIYSSDCGIPINLGRDEYQKKLLLTYTFWKQHVIKRGAENLKSVDVRFSDQIVVIWKNEINKTADIKI